MRVKCLIGVREGFFKEMVIELKPDCPEGSSFAEFWEESILGKTFSLDNW